VKRLFLVLFFHVLFFNAFAQQYSVTGVVADSTDNTSLIGVSVILQNAKDTTQRRGVVTDIDGRFRFTNLAPGTYILKSSYIGYNVRQRRLQLSNADLDLGTLTMAQTVTRLKGVEVRGQQIQVEQKGDTVQYNANAFKTNRDATVEDLINKMPGITSDGTGVKAQGEAVQQVLVDGKPFFGDDPNMALKNLPAELIDKIEVFDRLSDQAQFTGFDDGQTRKTINIVTRKDRNKGEFGKVYAGTGEDGRYIAGANINSFKGVRKMSIIGLTNNINQQNFSTDDLLGVTGSGGGGGGRGGNGGGGGGGGGGGSAGNFLVGQQNGISKTNAAGLNYSNAWGKKVELTGSYFFNRANNTSISNLSRKYITSQDSALQYDEASRSTNLNYNHRANFRLEYKIDSANSLIVTPSISFQKNSAQSNLVGNYMSGTEPQSTITNGNGSSNEGYNFSNNILFRHRFAKRGRSISANVTTTVNNRDGDADLLSRNEYFDPAEITTINQHSDNYTDSYTLSGNIAFTEPLSKTSQLQLNYSPSYTKSKTDKKTYNFNEETGGYSDLDTLLTNKFENTYITQRGGISYRYNVRKYNFMAGLNYQQANLQSDQQFPERPGFERSFQNVLPQLMFNYRPEQGRNLRVFYRTSTSAPSISQLQNVIDNRNPLFLKTGNPDLKQSYTHSFTARYGKTNITTASSLLFLVGGTYVENTIGNASIIATSDTVVNGVSLTRGTQLQYPVNLNGNWTGRALFTYGGPVSKVKSNFNLNTGFNYNRAQALVNNAVNIANNYAFSQGIVLSSNISEKIDFTLSYTANYTIVKNTLQKTADNNYFNHTSSVRFNWIFWKGFVFNSTLNNTLYSGLSETYDRSIWLWNASLGYKFLKDQSLEVKVTGFDLLKQNNSISRNVTGSYIEDNQTNVLTRYLMLMVTYNLRNFRK